MAFCWVQPFAAWVLWASVPWDPHRSIVASSDISSEVTISLPNFINGINSIRGQKSLYILLFEVKTTEKIGVCACVSMRHPGCPQTSELKQHSSPTLPCIWDPQVSSTLCQPIMFWGGSNSGFPLYTYKWQKSSKHSALAPGSTLCVFKQSHQVTRGTNRFMEKAWDRPLKLTSPWRQGRHQEIEIGT